MARVVVAALAAIVVMTCGYAEARPLRGRWGARVGRRALSRPDSGNMGSHGGAWSVCTHLTKYGLNFDYGLALFLSRAFDAETSLEFGSGIGLYSDFVKSASADRRSVAIEPEDMHAGGIFDPSDPNAPIQVQANILDMSPAEWRAPPLGEFDLVFSIEVAEHIPCGLDGKLFDFLAQAARKYVVFSAGRPRQGGTGHVCLRPKAEWAKEFTDRGFVYLPLATERLSEYVDRVNKNHRENVFVLIHGDYAALASEEDARLVRWMDDHPTHPRAHVSELFPVAYEKMQQARAGNC